MDIAIKSDYLREETVRRLDRDLTKAVSQIRGGDAVQVQVSLGLTVKWDNDEGRVMIDYAHKAAVTQKGRFGLPRADELELNFKAPEPEDEEDEPEDDAAENQPRALSAPALPEGDIIEAEFTEHEPEDDTAEDGPESAVPSGDR